MSENVEALISRNHNGLRGLYGDNFTLPYYGMDETESEILKRYEL
jgi:hypothetical protein